MSEKKVFIFIIMLKNIGGWETNRGLFQKSVEDITLYHHVGNAFHTFSSPPKKTKDNAYG